MTLTVTPGPRQLRGDEKAAIVIYGLGPERAERLFGRMDKDDLRRFAHALHGLGNVTPEAIEAVCAEFTRALLATPAVQGGSGETRRFLGRFLPADEVDRIMEDVEGPAGRDVWERLSNAPEQGLADHCREERPQAVAVILSRLSPDKAAKVLTLLPDDRAREILIRLAHLGEVDEGALEDLKTTLERGFLDGLRRRHADRPSHEVIGALMDRLPGERMTPLMAHLVEEEPETAARVQKIMFTFDDIPDRVEPASLQKVVRACDKDGLLLALRLAAQTGPRVAEYFFENMSKRVVQQMREDMDTMGSVRVREAQAAQSEIIRIIRDLVKGGEIRLVEAGEAEATIG